MLGHFPNAISPRLHDTLCAASSGAPLFCRERLRSSVNLLQQLQHVAFDFLDINLDIFQRTRRKVLIKVAIEIDLVADDPNHLVLLVANGLIDPGVLTCGLTSRSKNSCTLRSLGCSVIQIIELY